MQQKGTTRNVFNANNNTKCIPTEGRHELKTKHPPKLVNWVIKTYFWVAIRCSVIYWRESPKFLIDHLIWTSVAMLWLVWGSWNHTQESQNLFKFKSEVQVYPTHSDLSTVGYRATEPSARGPNASWKERDQTASVNGIQVRLRTNPSKCFQYKLVANLQKAEAFKQRSQIQRSRLFTSYWRLQSFYGTFYVDLFYSIL